MSRTKHLEKQRRGEINEEKTKYIRIGKNKKKQTTT